MVEVKNIVNREITGIPKFEYWIQMQVQMEVCNLLECDFLETRFIEYDDVASFVADGTFTRSVDGKSKGVALLFAENGNYVYKYCPLDSTEAEFNLWNTSEMVSAENSRVWLKTIYWKLDQVSVVLVNHNKIWFNAAVPVLHELWDTIILERDRGYDHRSPNKRPKYCPEEVAVPKCLIKITPK